MRAGATGAGRVPRSDRGRCRLLSALCTGCLAGTEDVGGECAAGEDVAHFGHLREYGGHIDGFQYLQVFVGGIATGTQRFAYRRT